MLITNTSTRINKIIPNTTQEFNQKVEKRKEEKKKRMGKDLAESQGSLGGKQMPQNTV